MGETAEQRPRRRFTRELTAFSLTPFVVWLIGWAPEWFFIATIALVAGLALFEFLKLGEAKSYPTQKSVSVVLLLFLLTAFITPTLSVELGVFAVLLVIPAIYIFSRADLDEALPGSAVCVLSTLYVGMLTGALLRLRLDFPEGAKLVFFLLLVVWLGDAGAYYVGRRFGQRRLSPRVSPKKTVEGGIGGVITSVVAAAVIHFAFFPEFPLPHALIAAVILSTTGVIGDLAESLWKRSAAVKDSGSMLPGHGGFLDRFDSILFTAPFLYAYWFMLIHDFRLIDL